MITGFLLFFSDWFKILRMPTYLQINAQQFAVIISILGLVAGPTSGQTQDGKYKIKTLISINTAGY